MALDRGAVGWGVGLVTFGIGLLLRDIGAWPPRLSVWPVALLAAGFALLVIERSRPDRGEIAVPLVLIVVGGAFALRGLRIFPGVGLFPVLLIAIGIVLLVTSSRRSSRTGTTSLRVPLDGAERLRLVVNHGAGRLTIRGEESGEMLLDGDFAGGAEHEVRRDGDRVKVELRNPSRPWTGAVGWGPWNWSVTVNPVIPMDLELNTGAGKTLADLRALRVGECVLKTGASETEIIAPTSGRTSIRIDAGAASVTVRVPEGVEAEIRNRSALGGVDIDEFRFPRHGEHYRSGGYDDAADRVSIEIGGGLANFTVR
jgi:hypothetical protein